MGVSPRLFPRFHRGYMAKRDKGGMGTFDARNHLDKNDPGMPQFLRALNKKKDDKKKDTSKVKKTKKDEIVNGAYRRETEQDELMHEYSERRALERDSTARARRKP